MKTLSALLAIATLCLAVTAQAQAQDTIPVGAKPLQGNASLLRWENRIYRRIEKSSEIPLKVPRFCAAIRSTVLVMGEQTLPLDVSPEVDHWILSLKNPPAELSGIVVLEFDSAPLLIDELSPINQLGDGSLWLAAHFAKTMAISFAMNLSLIRTPWAIGLCLPILFSGICESRRRASSTWLCFKAVEPDKVAALLTFRSRALTAKQFSKPALKFWRQVTSRTFSGSNSKPLSSRSPATTRSKSNPSRSARPR